MHILPWFNGNAFPLYLAPMAGVTDPIFRTLCKELGADILVTEFVSTEGVLQAWERNRRNIEFEPQHRPLGIQIFGANPANMAKASRIIVDAMHPDFLDINCGCPVPKVVGKNGGSSLVKDLPLLSEIARSIVQSVGMDVPVTAKIRLGWDAQTICALETCDRLVQAGISAIAIHGRTRSQQYGGRADWDAIHTCAAACPVPVIGNGDISTPEDVRRIRETTAVSGVMIGRAAMTSPWIFAQTREYLRTGNIPPPPSDSERIAFILRHARLAIDSTRYGDELHTMRMLRSRLIAYGKGLPGGKSLRAQLARVESIGELEGILHETGH